MSYDLIFVPKSDDQSWEEALGAAEEDEVGDRPSPEIWASLLAATRQILGNEVSVAQDDTFYEVDDEATGVQLSYYAREAAITVPYWYRGERAMTIIRSVYQLAEAVEKLTGLPGFDPQLELPLPEAAARPDLAVQIFDEAAGSFTG